MNVSENVNSNYCFPMKEMNGVNLVPSSSMETSTTTAMSSFCWFDGIGIPVFAVDSAGSVCAWNRKLADRTGVTPKQVLDRPFSALIEQKRQRQQQLERGDGAGGAVVVQQGWEDALRGVLRSGKEVCTCKRVRLCVDGTTTSAVGANYDKSLFRIRLTSQKDISGRITGAVCFVEDDDDDDDDDDENAPGTAEESSTRATAAAAAAAATGGSCRNFQGCPASPETRHSEEEESSTASILEHHHPHLHLRTNNDDDDCNGMNFVVRPKNENSIRICPDNVAGVPILTVDAEGFICQWNKCMTQMTGYEEVEVLGTSIYFILDDSDGGSQQHVALESKLLSCCTSSRIRSTENGSNDNDSSSTLLVRLRSKEGRILPVILALLPQQQQQQHIYNSNTAPSGGGGGGEEPCCPGTVAVIAQDVSELLEQQQQQYTKGEAKMNMDAFVEGANLPIFGVNLNCEIDLWNLQTAIMSGVAEQQALGLQFLDRFVSPHFVSAVREVIGYAAREGIGTANFELEFRSRTRTRNNDINETTTTGSTTIHYLLANVAPRRNGRNEIVGVVFVAQDVTEAAQHDRAVAAMARELRQLVDTANAPVFGIDVTGRVNEWNDKTAEITGFGGDEAFNKPFVDTFVSPDLRDSVRCILDAALYGRGTTNYELEIHTRLNDVQYLLVNVTTRRDIENRIVGAICIAQDVTEASKHDRAVAAMASELRQLIDTANAPIFGIDCDGDINEWNDKTAEITGYTKEEAFDCSLVETFIVPEMQDSVQDVLDSALQGRGTSNYELEFQTKSSEVRHLLVNATTRRDAENNVVGVVGVAQDVTEAVQRDKAVAGMALELRQLIDTANAPIFGIDIDGNVNEWNRRTQVITGYSKEETFDEPLVERFIAPSMHKKVQEILDEALMGNETSNYELEFVAKSGEPRFMLVNATTRRDPEFNVVGVVGVAQDVTEDRKHSAELRKMQYLQATQAAKVETERNMTAYFAHELRNPLGAIDSALSAMPDNMPEAGKSLVSGMQLCTSFMSSIMNNLLDVRKMEEGKMTLHKVTISLKSLLSGVHDMLKPSVKKGVTFSQECHTAGRDWVLGDEHRIQQVLTNVVTNAIKYTVTGSVSISIGWGERDRVVFKCVDTGPGIPKSEQEKLFQKFVQRGGAPGTGLGLAIAKHLVDLTNGSIRFDSDPSVRPGTTCVVEMPLTLCEPPEVVTKKSSSDGGGAGEDGEGEDTSKIEEPLRFLVIDDVKMNRMMLRRRLTKAIAPNCIIAEACTGEEALEICGENSFDVIIVDQYMEEAGGVMVGTDVVYAMRRMRIGSIIIGCSGNDIDAEFLEAGCDWSWKKPMPSNAAIIAQLRTGLRRINVLK